MNLLRAIGHLHHIVYPEADNTEGQDAAGHLSGRLLSAWLLARGLLTKALSDTDELIRRPSPTGDAVDIRLIEWTCDDRTSFPMVTLTEPTQKWILE